MMNRNASNKMSDRDTELSQIRQAFNIASRRPRLLEDWAYQYGPRLLELLEQSPADADHPTCVGRWLVFDGPGSKGTLYTVDEAALIRYSAGTEVNGWLWYGPLPDGVERDDGGEREGVDEGESEGESEVEDDGPFLGNDGGSVL